MFVFACIVGVMVVVANIGVCVCCFGITIGVIGGGVGGVGMCVYMM